jgi:hypothetical protein
MIQVSDDCFTIEAALGSPQAGSDLHVSPADSGPIEGYAGHGYPSPWMLYVKVYVPLPPLVSETSA